MSCRITQSAAFRLSLLVLLLAATARGFADDAEKHRSVRLRFEWGGGQPQVWNGVVEVSDGRLHDLVSLGVEADEPGTIWIDGNAAWIRRTTPRAYDGFDVGIEAPETAILTLTLQTPASQSAGRQFQVRLAEVAHTGRIVDLSELEGRVSISRTPGDKLSVRINRPHLVFSPGEGFQATVQPHLMTRPAKPGTAAFEWSLHKARLDEVLEGGRIEFEWNEQTAERAVLPIEAKLPIQAGVYDLDLKLRYGRNTVSRVVQLVVIAEDRQVDTPNTSEETLVDSFGPAEAGLLRRADKRRSIAFFNGSMSKLFDFRGKSTASETSDAVKWRSYRLRINHPGQPHRLRLSLPGDAAHRFGFSLLEPNAAGQLMPLGLDCGVHDERATASTAGASGDQTYSIVFWPKVTDPILLVHDLGLGYPVEIDHIDVLELERLSRLNTDQEPADLRRRLVGPYMQKPLLAEAFGATEAFDPPSGRSLEDWVTFQTAADRLADYLQHAGFNSLLLAAFADGGAIYPSQLLQPTARYETGVYFSTGQDPIRKDVLELLFRVFDREGLTLVPELQFSTPLPELERRLAAEGDAARGIELVGVDGRSWREARGTLRGLAPYYNPLDSRVQQAIIDVVRELLQRYAAHDSLRDVAVQLSGTGYLQLPGLDWGYDDATVARFEKETKLKVPDGPEQQKYSRRHEFLTGPARQQWIRWRCEQLSAFHRKLADVVVEVKSDARLILSGNRVLRGDNPDDDAYAAVRSGQKLERLLLAKGLDFSLYKETPHLAVLKPTLWRVSGLRGIDLLDETLNDHPQLNRQFSHANSGVLFYRDPIECRIPEFDSISPWQPAFTWLAAQCNPGAAETHRRLARSLAAHDAQYVFDGGWMIPFGQEEQMRTPRSVIGQLPAIEFFPHDAPQPLVARFGRTGDQTYIYIINEMSGPLNATLRLSCPAGTPCQLVGRDGSVTLASTGESSSVQVPLGPHEIWACRLNDPNVRILSVTPAPSQAVLGGLSQRIQSFQARMNEARRSSEPTNAPLENPGFELAAKSGTPRGWDLVGQAQSRLDATNPRSGKTSLALTSIGSTPAAIGAAVPLGNVRMLSFSVWLRSETEGAKVRLEVEAKVAGSPRVQFIDVPVDTTWRRQEFRVEDIPAGRLKDAHVRVRLLDSATVWIDDAAVATQRVTDDDLRQLMKVVSATTLAWEDKRYADCERLLQGYWGQFLLDDSATPVPTIDPARTAKSRSRTRQQ